MTPYARQALDTLATAAVSRTHRDYFRHAAAEEIRPGVLLSPGSPHKFDFLLCQDCRCADPMMFVVHDALWASAGLTTGVICPTCFESRIGRRLGLQDFKVCPANEQIFYGALLPHPSPTNTSPEDDRP